uniref:T-cell activation inhibitor, mitochondrial n=1 Tax=Timema tahoe TaxID=61484 RepID=A0A7R9P0F7_9NEOP|nr:unnamed protein product [Timema tahoe]
MEKLCNLSLLELHRGAATSLALLCRYLSTAEVSTALRPFYFSVHPDLFGQYPAERTVNENSLKQLSSYLENLQQNRPSRPTRVTFYLRSQACTDTTLLKGAFRQVKISLAQRDVRKTVLSILQSCDLSTTYVDNIAPPLNISRLNNEIKFSKFNENHPIYSSERMKAKIKRTKDAEQLRDWLSKNVSDARKKLLACQPVRDEIYRLEKKLCDSLGLHKVVWDCGWNVTHFRGCLISFQSLATHHPDNMHVLQGRTLMFGNDTGVSLDGAVMLSSGEFLKNVHKQDAALLRIPAFERAVSQVLRNIQVVRRKFQPKVMANIYENHLRRLTTSLSDYQGQRGYPKQWPQSLDHFELVVETEAGPLMVSPTGQFIVPASCPAFLLVAFITSNLDQATERLLHYKSNKHVERSLHARCVSQLGLSALQKDDNITPDLMIAFCERLIAHSDELAPLLSGVRLWVTHYYSVLSDGDMCVPWNWKL